MIRSVFVIVALLTRVVSIEILRPDASTWKRTKCGAVGSPGVPEGPYQNDVDYPGNDLDPCGAQGCVLDADSKNDVCEKKCEATKDCVGYVFSPEECSTAALPLCWLKSKMEGNGVPCPQKCRNAQKIAIPAIAQPDIPSKWASLVNASITPLPKYPRPQMVRGGTDREFGNHDTWTNLNGLWEWEAKVNSSTKPPFNRTLDSSILVPFPVESCLSGVAPMSSSEVVKEMYYRLQFRNLDELQGQRVLLRFGAVDWKTEVFVNTISVLNNTGGYNDFEADITDVLKKDSNEILIYVFDPSDEGVQPNGKQRISAIDNPSGDTYSPNSGIWQTVWLEYVSEDGYVTEIRRSDQNSLTTLNVSAVTTAPSSHDNSDILFEVYECGSSEVLVSGKAKSEEWIALDIPDAKLWSPDTPYLYDLRVSYKSDHVLSYFGLRSFELETLENNITRPVLNGNRTLVYSGFLDQSWWPDGIYTAPTDEALEFDIQIVKTFGMNLIRLHQKINPERWYFAADVIGVIVFQDMVQKYGGATNETVPFFQDDMRRAILGRKNHPCIVQFTLFNEGDCWNVFDVPSALKVARSFAPDHLFDTDSGGKANDLHIGDVNDIHTYPQPGDTQPSKTQYAMIGEYGGIGAFIDDKQWKPKMCHAYLPADTPAEEASYFLEMMAKLLENSDHISAAVYTQTTDVELECDGFLNFDRTHKFNSTEIEMIRAANDALIHSSFK